jgi:SAM-dependent methyltransferase
MKRDWEAATYDRVSGPQVEWAERVLDRLPLRGDETVLDAGCGSGRVTRMLIDRLPAGHVIAVDSAPSMVEHAREALGEDATVLQAGLTELELEEDVGAGETAERLRRAGFDEIETWLEPYPVAPADPSGYLRSICLGNHLERLPEGLRASYVEDVRARCGPELDYVRLNIDARRPA